MLLLLDNYDSFVHNLARYFRCQGHETTVVRSDQIDIKAIESMQPHALIISPGPKAPSEAGCSVAAIQHFANRLPIFGVCLGHQAIAEAFGGAVEVCPPMHGMPSLIHHRGSGLFEGLPNPFRAARYHSLAVNINLPSCLEATAWTEATDNPEHKEHHVMSIQHKTRPIYGVQFHPESILTEHGDCVVKNFLKQAGLEVKNQENTAS